jgi:F-type H+-transporting ATPase subunit a
MHPVSISAEKIFTLFGSFNVTNSLLATWIVMVILIVIAVVVSRSIKEVPTGIQNVFEMVIEGFLGLIETVTEDKKRAREFFAFAFSIFLFILFSNWLGLIPGVGAIGFTELEPAHAGEVAKSVFVPLLRAGSSDLSFTLALAIITVIYIQYMGIKHLGFAYFKKFINFDGPIQFFVGILEIISEAAKTVSFSFRLFGNIFAGEVLLLVMTFLAPFIVPVPFYGLEVFVGIVQALVFMMLSLVFINSATHSH